MTEMVERVARALRQKRDGISPVVEGFVMLDMSRGEIIGDWRDHARAAIAAMREPTEAMCVAGIKTGAVDNGVFLVQPHSLKVLFEAMIDAALK